MYRSLPLIGVLFLLLITGSLEAQSNPAGDREVGAPYSASRMAAFYYDIEFSKAQRDSLGDREIELILLIDTAGYASLYRTNNVSDPAIIDSLSRKTEELPPFTPPIEDGEILESVYTLYFSFPKYRAFTNTVYSDPGPGQEYRRLKIEDFDYLERSNQRLDLLFSGMANQFVGRPARYLGFGGGFNMDISYADRKARVYGLFMSFYGNKQRLEYPIITTRELNSAPPTLLVGLLYGRYLDKWLIQGELGFAQQNLSPSLSDDDRDWLRTDGATLGIIASRTFALGKGQFDYMYGAPTVSAGHINVHAGLRYQKYGLAEASGLMLEVGLGYRLSTFVVESFRVRDLKR